MKPGKMDEAIGVYRDSVVPILKAQKGFKALYWLGDRNTDKYLVITPTIERYEVTLQA